MGVSGNRAIPQPLQRRHHIHSHRGRTDHDDVSAPLQSGGLTFLVTSVTTAEFPLARLQQVPVCRFLLSIYNSTGSVALRGISAALIRIQIGQGLEPEMATTKTDPK